MRQIKRLCPWCQTSFIPNTRLGKRQKSCGLPPCQKKQKDHSQRQWKSKNKKLYQQGLKDWREQNGGYWKNYRLLNPEYTEINRKQSRIRKRLSIRKTGLQKRIDVLQGHEKQWELWDVVRFAKYPRSLVPLVYAKSFDEKINSQTRRLC